MPSTLLPPSTSFDGFCLLREFSRACLVLPPLCVFGALVGVCVHVQLPPQAVTELVVLSDELNINEVVCVELWSQVTTLFCCV